MQSGGLLLIPGLNRVSVKLQAGCEAGESSVECVVTLWFNLRDEGEL